MKYICLGYYDKGKHEAMTEKICDRLAAGNSPLKPKSGLSGAPFDVKKRGERQ